MAAADDRLDIQVLSSAAELSPNQWNALVGDDDPFLEWEWIASLEQAGCVGRTTGWKPRHMVVRDGNELVGLCPVYAKEHSRGEFVYDFSWAQAASRAGIRYYPKLLVAVPFTPATGRRFPARPDRASAVLTAVARALVRQCHEDGFSSVHVNFCSPAEAESLRAEGFLVRLGYQFHWRNEGWDSFEHYLEALRSKRRNQIRRERRALRESAVTVEVLRGSDLSPELVNTMYDLYAAHLARHPWSRRYLNRQLFHRLLAIWNHRLCLSIALEHGRVVAGALAIQGRSTLYGRYWGSFTERRFLHFEVCYYRLIEYCLEKALRRFEPGAGGEFKELRGFRPTRTYSAHYIADPRLRAAISRFLHRERTLIESELEWWQQHSSYRRDE